MTEKTKIVKNSLSTEEKHEKLQKEIENKFCTVRRQQDHISALNQLSLELEYWCQENEISLGAEFIAAKIQGLVCPYPSTIHYNKDMTVSLEFWSWTIRVSLDNF